MSGIKRWPLVIVGVRRPIHVAWLDAWLRAALKPQRGVA